MASKMLTRLFSWNKALAAACGKLFDFCSVGISRDGKLVAAGAADGAIKIWELTSSAILAEFNHGAQDAKVAWGPDACQLISGAADGSVRIWRVPQVAETASFSAHSKQILKLLVIDSERLISVSADRTARICRLPTGECVRILEGHTGSTR